MSRRDWERANREYRRYYRHNGNRHHSSFFPFDLIFSMVGLAINIGVAILGAFFSVFGALFSTNPVKNSRPSVNPDGQPVCSNDNRRYGDLSKFDNANGNNEKSTAKPNTNSTEANQKQNSSGSNSSAAASKNNEPKRNYEAAPNSANTKHRANNKNNKDDNQNKSGSDWNILIFILTLIPVIIFLAMEQILYAGISVLAGIFIMVIYNILKGIVKATKKHAEEKAEDKQEAAEENETEKLIREAFDKVFAIRKNIHKVSNEAIRGKVDNLCTMSEKIIGEVRTNPENMKVVKKFFYYYLDAFDDIFNRYLRISTFNNSSEEIDKSIAETEKAFNEIEEVLKDLCEDLIESDMLNIKATINVIKNSQ